MNSLLIPRNITALLQSVRDLVARGYYFWTAGTIKTLKAENLCKKFNEHYEVLAPKPRRDYNRKLGKANVYLFMYPQTGGDVLDWLLIATHGTGAIHQKETLHNHHSEQHTDRLRWRHYEIVEINDRMTWRLQPKVAEEWEKKVVASARKKYCADLNKTVEMLYNFPMFTGVRKQVSTIVGKAIRTRKRHHYEDSLSFPTLPVMRRIQAYDNPPKTLGQLIDEYQARLKAAL